MKFTRVYPDGVYEPADSLAREVQRARQVLAAASEGERPRAVDELKIALGKLTDRIFGPRSVSCTLTALYSTIASGTLDGSLFAELCTTDIEAGGESGGWGIEGGNGREEDAEIFIAEAPPHRAKRNRHWRTLGTSGKSPNLEAKTLAVLVDG